VIAFISVYIHIYVCVCGYIRVCAYRYTYIYIYMCVCECIPVYIHIYMCVYIHVCVGLTEAVLNTPGSGDRLEDPFVCIGNLHHLCEYVHV